MDKTLARMAMTVAAIGLVMTLTTATVSAAPVIEVTSGVLTGIRNVGIGGSFYDVAFADGRCADLFSVCGGSGPLYSDAFADAAAAALVEAFSSAPAFNNDPSLTAGCAGAGQTCFMYTPGSTTIPGPLFLAGLTRNDTGPDVESLTAGLPLDADFSSIPQAVWARWTLRSTPLLQVSNGILTGVQNVEVAGTFYDVEFVDGNCADLFAVCGGPGPLYSDAFADSAAAALVDVLRMAPIFNNDPSLTAGCIGAGQTCFLYTPGTTMIPGPLFLAGLLRNDAGPDITSLSAGLAPGSDFSSIPQAVWGRWTPRPPNTVPEPATASLVCLGLLALGAIRAKRS